MRATSKYFFGRNIPEINHSQQSTNLTRIISLAHFFFRASILPATKILTARNADARLRITAMVGFATDNFHVTCAPAGGSVFGSVSP